jgi:hypothetical protein
METKEYIVILHSYTDLDDFYTDMEQAGHYEHVPNRAVELVHRRPSSRSTHYQLTDDEVRVLRQDPRVLDIHRPYYDLGYEVVPCVSQTSDHWSKGDKLTQGSPEMNWGLLRCVEGKTRPNWGDDASPRVVKKVSATIDLPNTGQHVDLVIVDGHIRPDHPEFAKNADGTGGSRVIQYKWFKEHWQQVLGYRPRVTRAGVEEFLDYEYDFRSSTSRELLCNNHGASDAGIAAGNTCGFARDANIYNISPYTDTTINGDYCSLYNIASFIEEFHKNKLVNPATGRRNPTIANLDVMLANPTILYPNGWQGIRYKGQTYTRDNKTGMWPQDAFRKTGAENSDGEILAGARDNSVDQDIMDAIAAGVIFTAAAGNDSLYMDRPGNVLYDTAFTYGATLDDNAVYPLRGASPGSAPGVICVGALDATVVEKKAVYSNKGPRIDIYAPAVNTIGARNTINDTPITTPAPGITTTTTTRPPFRATCTFNPYPTSVNEGASITFAVNTTGLPSGGPPYLYWTIVFSGLANGNDFDFDPETPYRPIEIGGDGRGTFTVTIRADAWTEGTETFRVSIHDIGDPLSSYVRPIATTDPITIADTSQGTQGPPGYDSRNINYFKDTFGGTSAACPHVAGIIACALETYPNMTPTQALSYIQTYADHGVLRDTPLNTDYAANQWLNDQYILFNGPNMHVRYQPNTRPNQVQPAIGHKSRPATGGVYPRTRITKS